jgi:aspartate carbamoyltransferase catalytic subunit
LPSRLGRPKPSFVNAGDGMHGHPTQELLDELSTQEAMGRAAEPWEVANVIVFLASDLASYMTGECVSVSSQHP